MMLCAITGNRMDTFMAFRTLTIVALALVINMPAVAQPTPSVTDPGPPLSGYPRKALAPPTSAELETATYIRDVVYGHRDGMALTYDVFVPKNANGAMVVNMVSAGWVSSWGPPEERQARYQWLIDKGFTVVALYHASAPRFAIPDAVRDVQLGLRHIKLHAADYGVDPARIGVWGASAGGHLALVAGLMADDGNPAATTALERADNRVTAVVAYFPPTDFEKFWIDRPRAGALAFDDALRAGISPINFVDSTDAPTLIISGGADTVVPVSQSETLQAVLDRAAVENELVVFPDADHDFYVKGDPARTDAHALDAMNRMVQWFEQHLE
jgi:acetyl esterase/lipase